jgi:hypothetical protein
MSFTLEAYCTAPITMKEIPKNLKYHAKVMGNWDSLHAGGSPNGVHPSPAHFFANLNHSADQL